MKQLFLSAIVMIAIWGDIFSQDVIARQHNGETIFHYLTVPYTTNDLQAIISISSDNDTLYLPGITFITDGDITIAKRLVLVGGGIHEDSATVIGAKQTNIEVQTVNHKLWLTSPSAGQGASGSELHGLKITGLGSSAYQYIRIGTGANDQYVSNLKIIRCAIDGDIYLGPSTSAASQANNIAIQHCHVKGRIYVNRASNVYIRNNVIENIAASSMPINHASATTWITNNLILRYKEGNAYGPTYESNIITATSSLALDVDNIYNNNLWLFGSGTETVSFTSPATGNANNPARVITSIFNTPTPSLTTYDYQSDYHLNNAHTDFGLLNNLGGSGQAGLYGGNTNAWKDGILPFNPHWVQFPNSLGVTDNGLLAVPVKASAQLENIAGNKADSIRYWSDVSQTFPSDMKAVRFKPTAQFVDDTLLFDFCDYIPGTKRIYFQVHDTRGFWSSVIYRDVTVVAPPTAFSITLNGGSLTSPYALGLQWYREDGNPVSGASQTPFTPLQSDRYYAVLTNGCDTLYSDTLLFCVPMETPTVTFMNDTLTASAAYAYQWYNSNGAIQGETSQIYRPTMNGSYYVVISDALGCTSPQSAIVNVTINGLDDLDTDNISLYPNPNQGWFTIQTSVERGHLEIFNVTGERIKDFELNTKEVFIQLSQPTGLYFLKISNAKGVFLRRIVLQ